MDTLLVAIKVAEATEKTRTRSDAVKFWEDIPKSYRKEVLRYIKYQELEIIENALERGVIKEGEYIEEVGKLK